jgi:transposase
MLAELLRTNSRLLKPVEHRSDADQRLYSLLVARDIAVQSRTKLVNNIRGQCKAAGARLSMTSTPSFPKTLEEVPAELKPALGPLYDVLDTINKAIAGYEKQISAAIEREHPKAKPLTEIAGVGDLTALAFVLCVGNVSRFKRSRDVGCYFGLVPKVRESGESQPQLRISKQGNGLMRRLLVNAAHYVLGPFNKQDSDLKDWGLRIAGGAGDPKRKKKAVIAVARKLAVTMAAMLRDQAAFVPRKPKSEKLGA